MADFKKDYKAADIRQKRRLKVPRVTLTKVEPASDDKRTRAELLDAIEDLFQDKIYSSRKQSYERDIDLDDLRSILTMLVLSATNSEDDSIGATQQQVDAINANTLKTGITETQARNIQDNNLKNSISTSQANAIIANTAKTTFPGFGTTSGKALEGNTNLLQLGTTSSTALAGDTTTITTAQANAITANTAKVSQGLNTANSSMTFDVLENRGAYSIRINVVCNDGATRTFTASLR